MRAEPDRFRPSAYVVGTSDEPRSYAQSQRTSEASLWRDASLSQMQTLKDLHTWDLVPRAAGMKILSSKWVFRRKLLPSGLVDKYKARLVVLRNHQVTK